MKLFVTGNTPEPIFDDVFCGVSMDDDTPIFNWSRDTSKDIINLTKNCSSEFNSEDIRYIYSVTNTQKMLLNPQKRNFVTT